MMKQTMAKTSALGTSLGMALLLLLSFAAAARAQQAVVPGRSAGGVFLGMRRGDVWKILLPSRHRAVRSSALLAPHRAGRYTVDEWGSGNHSLTVLYRDARVVQVEVNSPALAAPGGVSVATPFAAVRKRYPRMRVDEYGVIQILRDGSPSDELLFYVDDVRRGIAFTHGTQDDETTYDELPDLKPDSLIVHRPGQRVLPVDADPDTRVSPEPRSWNDFLPAIRAWFAGGPHRPHQKTTKGSH